jgi:S1-C subfamily serine protease
MRDLRPGERLDIAGDLQEIWIESRNAGSMNRFNAVIIPLDANDKTIPAFPAMVASDRELRSGLCFKPRLSLACTLSKLPPDVAKLTLVLYVIGGRSAGIHLGENGEFQVHVNKEYRFPIDMNGRRDTALIVLELYQRSGKWRIAANGQGFNNGIPGVNQALKLDLDITDAKESHQNRPDEFRPHPGDSDDNRPPAGATSGGSGFAIGPRMVVTNYHVVEHAAEITVIGENGSHVTANVIANDPVNDIALLMIAEPANGVARFRPDIDIDLGEDVIVAGFPLSGLLGQGPQVSGGNISALTGIRGDSTQVQFNSPIGSGSSGGPMIDSGGLVVGLVRAVLRSNLEDAPVAQNINFGVKAALVRSFLHAAGVTPVMGIAGPGRPRAEIAREARTYLYRICIRH